MTTQGKSLNNNIETNLLKKTNSVSVEVSENPSPSGDPWFDDPKNIELVRLGIEDLKANKCRAYTIDEIKNLLEL
jgi:hypothetical protein